MGSTGVETSSSCDECKGKDMPFQGVQEVLPILHTCCTGCHSAAGRTAGLGSGAVSWQAVEAAGEGQRKGKVTRKADAAPWRIGPQSATQTHAGSRHRSGGQQGGAAPLSTRCRRRSPRAPCPPVREAQDVQCLRFWGGPGRPGALAAPSGSPSGGRQGGAPHSIHPVQHACEQSRLLTALIAPPEGAGERCAPAGRPAHLA